MIKGLPLTEVCAFSSEVESVIHLRIKDPTREYLKDIIIFRRCIELSWIFGKSSIYFVN